MQYRGENGCGAVWCIFLPKQTFAGEAHTGEALTVTYDTHATTTIYNDVDLDQDWAWPQSHGESLGVATNS